MCSTIDWTQTQPVWATTPTVIAAWAFGSAQAGVLRPGGDIDIGILVEAPLTLVAQLDLLMRLQAALHVEDIDLVILNNANPILRFEAISGRLLFCRDAQCRAEFASLTAREYEDEMALWQRSLRYRQSAD